MVKRNPNAAMEQRGVQALRSALASHCTIQEIARENDVGNDVYIEFFVENEATGACVVAQIKSGASYKSGKGHFVPVTTDQIEYWRLHILPVLGIVYDPDEDSLHWCDVTMAITDAETKNETLGGRLYCTASLSNVNSEHFREHCLGYRNKYKDAAAKFASVDGLLRADRRDRAYEAVRSLFAYYRDDTAVWRILISSFRLFRGTLTAHILSYYFSLLVGHGDVFWTKKNIIPESARREALVFLRHNTTYEDVVAMAECINVEVGIGRGTLGQSIHVVLSALANRHVLLEKLATDYRVSSDIRLLALQMYMYNEQAWCPNGFDWLFEKYFEKFPEDREDERFLWLHEISLEEEPFDVY